MRLYHGSSLSIPQPDVQYSRAHLDFGPGFYVTSFQEQAERWAQRKALRTGGSATVSIYEFHAPADLTTLSLQEDRAWLDFVCACRRGEGLSEPYGLVVGPVADDRVYDAIDLYYRGLWDVETTLRAIRFYRLNDQYCFVTQRALESSLSFVESYEVKL